MRAVLPSAPFVADAPLAGALAAHLRPLRALVAVARHGTTVGAAEAIHLSQPAVARAILELEKACGLALFSRAARGMAPTIAGAQLAARAETLFAHLSAGAAEALAATPGLAQRPAAPERFAALVRPCHLRALVAIAACGTEKGAAVTLGLSQPAIHSALQGLEHALATRLFYKLTSGTRLTPAGESLLRRVKLAFAEVRAMENDVAAWRGEVRGRIVVGVLPLSVCAFLPLAVESLVAAHPDIEVQIVDGTYESLVRQLLCADIDVIAGALRADAAPEVLTQVHLFDDDLVVVARANHPCLQQQNLQLHDLAHHDWVTPLPGTPAARALEQTFRSSGMLPPTGALQASSPALTGAFVLKTGRLAIASRVDALADSEQGRLRIVPVRLPATLRQIGVAVRAVGRPSHDLDLFLQACRAAAPAAAR